MAVKLRLARRGAKKSPFYHVVATDSRNPRDGKFNEEIGTYDPNFSPARVNIKQDRLDHWLKMGAQPSATVAQLIKLAKKTAAQTAKRESVGAARLAVGRVARAHGLRGRVLVTRYNPGSEGLERVRRMWLEEREFVV